jgi:hypothetical protein
MQELQGVGLLRRLANMPQEDRIGEPHDAGWCCNEHALIASLAFCYLGVRAEMAEGKAAFVDRDAKQILVCSPHWFVVLGTKENPAGLFDSSASVGPVNGVPVGYKRWYPQLTVSLNLPLPSSDEIWTLSKSRPERFSAIYEPHRSDVPGRAAVKHVSSTPLGRWITGVIGSQDGIWAKAAVVVAKAFAAGEPQDPPARFCELSKPELWSWIATTPNVDELVLKRAAAIV